MGMSYIIHTIMTGLNAPVMWNDYDRLFPQAPEHYEELIRRAEEALAEEPDDSSYELGGVLVRKSGGHLDVYVYLGDILAHPPQP